MLDAPIFRNFRKKVQKEVDDKLKAGYRELDEEEMVIVLGRNRQPCLGHEFTESHHDPGHYLLEACDYSNTA